MNQATSPMPAPRWPVIAGIAAADVICCSKLGRHHQGDDHRGAIDLLATVDAGLGRHLKTCLTSRPKRARAMTPSPLRT